MLGPVLGLIAAAAPPAVPAAPDLRHDYQACPGQDVLARAANVGWGRTETLIAAHRTLRDALHVLMPEGTTRILWYANGGDLATTTFSVIAVRGAGGRWHIDGVGQTLIWIQGAQPTPLPRFERELSAEESLRLDHLLDDPYLYAGPTFLRDPNIMAGGLFSTLEVETPRRRWIGAWHVLPTRQESEVLEMIGQH
jgi:hypothetical protein